MSILKWTASIVVLNLVACSASPDDQVIDDVGTTQDPIIGGTVSPAGQAVTQGWIRVNHNGGICTGTLVQNDLVITAKHCTTTDGQINGPADNVVANYNVQMGGQTRAVTEVLRHATQDVALIQLGNFLAPGAGVSRFDWNRTIYTGSNASLLNSSLLCYGYGNNTITDCTPTRTGTGSGTLRQGNIQVTATSSTALTFSPTGVNETIQFRGDSGGSCLFGSVMVGIHSTGQCTDSPLEVTSTQQVGPEAYRVWANGIIDGRGRFHVHTANAGNISGHITTLNHTSLNGVPGAMFHTTANWNPGGAGGTYNNAHTGIWYNSSASRWTIFNQGFTAMPTNAAFNWWKSTTNISRHTATAANIVAGMPHVTRLDLGAGNNSNPNLMLVVTQFWDGVYNNHAVGVWFDPVSARWYLYNEDQTALPVNAKFNVSIVSPVWGGFVHTSSASSISGNSTYLNHENINGQPNAQFVVTHNFKLGGGSTGTYHTAPVGVWYNTSTQRWAVFNQNLANMPAGVTFNVMVRP